jgi:hypothetical protein
MATLQDEHGVAFNGDPLVRELSGAGRKFADHSRSANGPERLALVEATVGATHAVWRQGRPGRTKTGRRTTPGNLFLQANPIVMLMIESLSLNMKHVVR